MLSPSGGEAARDLRGTESKPEECYQTRTRRTIQGIGKESRSSIIAGAPTPGIAMQ
jgi:hypothetical protein